MNFLKKLLTSSSDSLVDSIANVADRFITTDDEQQEFELAVERLLQQRDSEIEQTIRAELAAKERILVAELQQGDNYTKRARPTVVYAGLVFIFLNYVLIPLLSTLLATETITLSLPHEFWLAWGGICATWVVGRSAEKRGSRHPIVTAITGSQARSTLMD